MADPKVMLNALATILIFLSVIYLIVTYLNYTSMANKAHPRCHVFNCDYSSDATKGDAEKNPCFGFTKSATSAPAYRTDKEGTVWCSGSPPHKAPIEKD